MVEALEIDDHGAGDGLISGIQCGFHLGVGRDGFSSSLFLARGEGTSFRSTATYMTFVIGTSKFD